MHLPVVHRKSFSLDKSTVNVSATETDADNGEANSIEKLCYAWLNFYKEVRHFALSQHSE